MARIMSGPLVLGEAPCGMPLRSSKAPARKLLRTLELSFWKPICSKTSSQLVLGGLVVGFGTSQLVKNLHGQAVLAFVVKLFYPWR